MIELSIKIVDNQGRIKAENKNSEEVYLLYEREYEEGDKIILSSSEINTYLVVQLDDALGSTFAYIKKHEVIYQIPFGEKRESYSPKVFTGFIHLLFARSATVEEVKNYKNLALNVLDQHGEPSLYPHASANVETRGESVFAARNAIDGVRVTHSHGSWPYGSWGINRQDDATLKVEFGRMVCIDKIILYTRADFPHDNWWEKVTLTFSDGSEVIWKLVKSDKGQMLKFFKKEVEWVQLNNLMKADDPSPFPALTQLEIYGTDII